MIASVLTGSDCSSAFSRQSDEGYSPFLYRLYGQIHSTACQQSRRARATKGRGRLPDFESPLVPIYARFMGCTVNRRFSLYTLSLQRLR